MITDANLAESLKPHRDPAGAMRVWVMGVLTGLQVLIVLVLFATHADARSLAMAVFLGCILVVGSAVTLLRHVYLTPLYRASKAGAGD